MKKFLLSGLLVTLLTIGSSATEAHANGTGIGPWDYYWQVLYSVEKYYTVEEYGSTTPFSKYPEDVDAPWLYIKVDLPGPWDGVFTDASIYTEFYKDGQLLSTVYTEYGRGQNEFWITPSNWNQIHNPGYEVWTVHSLINYRYNGCDYLGQVNQSTMFCTPEPVSTSLFLLGSGALGFRRIRRKR